MHERSVTVEGQKQFDYKTVHICPKSGKVLRRADYIMTVDGNGMRFESPPGSGIIFNPKGECIHDGQKEAREKADALKAAEDKKLADAAEAQKAALYAKAKAEVRAELEAIAAEKEAKGSKKEK